MGAEIDQSELKRILVGAQLQRESTIRRTILDDLTQAKRQLEDSRLYRIHSVDRETSFNFPRACCARLRRLPTCLGQPDASGKCQLPKRAVSRLETLNGFRRTSARLFRQSTPRTNVP